ncbi:Annexin-2 receptor [Sciurus carolinensis]|uniref:Annexin-2 receptor n=1 Tax=Sciurus carolinensis TaxID=30640 RepID=A0AA41MJ97_SCICA|nr:Annexin-2 receptor [Sciurus carolinensis]
MEKHLPCCVREAWDGGEEASGPQALPALKEADFGPWPLPFYPRLGLLSWDRQDSNPEILLRPCGFLSGACPLHGPRLNRKLRKGTEPPACPGATHQTQEEPRAPPAKAHASEKPGRPAPRLPPWTQAPRDCPRSFVRRPPRGPRATTRAPQDAA